MLRTFIPRIHFVMQSWKSPVFPQFTRSPAYEERIFLKIDYCIWFEKRHHQPGTLSSVPKNQTMTFNPPPPTHTFCLPSNFSKTQRNHWWKLETTISASPSSSKQKYLAASATYPSFTLAWFHFSSLQFRDFGRADYPKLSITWTWQALCTQNRRYYGNTSLIDHITEGKWKRLPWKTLSECIIQSSHRFGNSEGGQTCWLI